MEAQIKNAVSHKIELGKYRHFKGDLYQIIGIAHDSETLEELVVYQGLYESDEWGKNPIWVRPVSMFTDYKEIDGKKVKRFVRV